MSADLLRRAAGLLRERAERCQPGPLGPRRVSRLPRPAEHLHGCGSIISMHPDTMGGDIAAPNGDLYPRGGYSPFEDMQYIALMHPPVALALADWLDGYATLWDRWPKTLETTGDDPSAAAVALVARSILRESP